MEHSSSPAVPASDPLARDPSVTRALATRTDFFLVGTGLLAGVLLSARLCFPEKLGWPIDHHLGSQAMLFALPIAVFPLVIALSFIGWGLTPWRRGLELAWLAALPFPFAHRAYLLALKRDFAGNDLQLLLTFEHPPKQADVDRLFEKRLTGSKLTWQDERCVMVRSPLGLSVSQRSGNAGLHRWFRRVAAPLLVTLHRDAGLMRVELRS